MFALVILSMCLFIAECRSANVEYIFSNLISFDELSTNECTST